MKKLVPCLWFNGQAEEAARYYASVFDDARVVSVTRYASEGEVMTVAFSIAGHEFVALNGGPTFQFNEAVSFQVICRDQHEVDYYWERLSEGGDEQAQQCGWLKDRFGLSWQVVPEVLPEFLGAPGHERRERVMQALLRMKKLDIAGLRQAYDGVGSAG